MGTSKKERLRLNESDLVKLNSMTRELETLTKSIFELKELDLNFPVRYLFLKNEIEYEFIFSQMGSFTVRLAKSERYRRNPPPIFYLSIGKYSDSNFTWEDLNGDEFEISEESLKQEIFLNMEKYEVSMREF